MKLFEPEAAEHLFLLVVPINAKEGAMPDFKCIRAGDMESALRIKWMAACDPAAPTAWAVLIM